jgi:squalene-hopene/tetraprenyl-beta-curcumene cyclase
VPNAPATSLTEAVERGRRGLLRRQRSDGHWIGELQGDTILESEWILLMAFLGREHDPRIAAAANYLLEHQQKDGGWSNYPGGPADLSITVKAYFALKIAGHSPDAEYMQRAAEVVSQLGGAENCNSFTRFYLAMLGQSSYATCPTVPPEIMLLPRWFYFNIYAMSAWSRTIFVPLSVVSAYRPVRQLAPRQGIRELFIDPPEKPQPPAACRGWLSWTNFFLRVDALLKWLERWKLTPFRRRALRKAVEWMREHYADSDGLGAIFPPMIYNAIVLRCLGVPDDDPEIVWALKQLDDLMIPERDTLRLQPCHSPVWDTALALIALADAQLMRSEEGGVRRENHRSSLLTPHSSLQKGVDWLLEREVRRPGDWSWANRGLEPGGWCFEYRNGFYPDVDDTAMVLMALARTGHAKQASARPAVQRGLRWLLGMQNSDGGWAAFDRNINRRLLEKVPFADHNAMLDPSCPDITARVLEALGYYGHRPDMQHVGRALAFIERNQEENGSWRGRWGVNYIYGTWQVLVGLKSIGHDMTAPLVRRAVAWLKSAQQTDGAWGESCRSYDDPAWAGRGEPTASQTAWALLGLIAAGEATSPEVRAGIEWLLASQQEDGGWTEEPFTGTGFPKVFYLKYHLYSVYFPLMAIARYQAAMGRG